MKKYLFLLAVGLLLSGCATRPEYFEELTAAEQTQLVNSARTLALQGKAVPDHLRGVFAEVVPYQRIIYEGNKRGRATFRWEIYEKRRTGGRLTQKDINPYWVIVYAIGDLRDPSWKLSHANQGTLQPASAVQPDKQQKWQVNRVRYKN